MQLAENSRPLTRRQRHAVRRYTNPRGYHSSTEYTLDEAAHVDSLISPQVHAALADMVPDLTADRLLSWDPSPTGPAFDATTPVAVDPDYGIAYEVTDSDESEVSGIDAFRAVLDGMAHVLALAFEDDCIDLFKNFGRFNLRRWAQRQARRVRMARKRRRGW